MRLEGLGGFFLRGLGLLPVLLGTWFLLRDAAVQPLAWLSEAVMRFAFYWVMGTETSAGDSTLTLLTNLQVPMAGGFGLLTPEVNLLTFSYGTPFLATLLIAAGTPGLRWKLPLALVLLLPFQCWGVCFAWLLQVAVLAGEHTAKYTYFGAFARNAIAAGYQFGFLILPTLAPVVLWLALDRRVLRRVIAESALSAALTAPQEKTGQTPEHLTR